MGQIATTFADWHPAQTLYSAQDNVFQWVGPPCPPQGMVIPDTFWGRATFPGLVGSPYHPGGDCSGGLAERTYFNPDTGAYGSDAWKELRPGVPNPAYQDLDLIPGDAGEGAGIGKLLLVGAVLWAIFK